MKLEAVKARMELTKTRKEVAEVVEKYKASKDFVEEKA